MIEIEGLNLIVTNKCNISCRHCGFSAGPHNTLVMPLENAKAYIREISKHPKALLISYTGGEPFLFYDYLTELLSFAAKLGLYGELVTNSFWAENLSETKKKLRALKDLGAVNFVTSLDDYHAEFINPDYIKNAVLTACELDYHVTVKITEPSETIFTQADSAKTKFNHAYVLEYLAAEKNKIKVISQPLIHVGRGKNVSHSSLLKGDELKKLATAAVGKCRTILRFPAINPAGEVYPCCGFGEKCRLIGNTHATSLAELFTTMQGNLFFHLLAQIGPQQILALAAKYLPTAPPNDFLNICEACNYIVQDAPTSQAVRCLLHEFSAKIS